MGSYIQGCQLLKMFVGARPISADEYLLSVSASRGHVFFGEMFLNRRINNDETSALWGFSMRTIFCNVLSKKSKPHDLAIGS